MYVYLKRCRARKPMTQIKKTFEAIRSKPVIACKTALQNRWKTDATAFKTDTCQTAYVLKITNHEARTNFVNCR